MVIMLTMTTIMIEIMMMMMMMMMVITVMINLLTAGLTVRGYVGCARRHLHVWWGL